MEINAVIFPGGGNDLNHAERGRDRGIPAGLAGTKVSVIDRQRTVVVLHEAAIETAADGSWQQLTNGTLTAHTFHKAKVSLPVFRVGTDFRPPQFSRQT